MFYIMQERLESYGKLIRWDRQVGNLLLLWPTLTALFIASYGRPAPKLFVLFLCGVFLMRAAGCILNDLTDRNIDKNVARTRQRPLAIGSIKRREAFLLLGILLIIAFLFALQLNALSIKLAFVTIALTTVYPWLKRLTNFPQVGLGITFNFGILIAFSAVRDHLPAIAWLLFLIALIWTVAYDTIYGMVDKNYDLKIGVKSTAIAFGQHLQKILAAMHFTIIVLLFCLGTSLQFNAWYYFAVIACGFSFIWQHLLLKDNTPTQCFKAFNNNQWSWLFIFLGVLLNYV